MKSRNLSRRSLSPTQKRRSFFRWLRPQRQDSSTGRKLRFESLEDRRVLAGFVPGSIDGQDGWSGGTIAISPNVDQTVDQSGANAHTGIGSWQISNNTADGNHNGAFAGWPFGPGLTVTAGQPDSGAGANQFNTTFYFRAANAVADGSNIEVDLGSSAGDDRTTFLAITNDTDGDGGLKIRAAEPDGATGNFHPTLNVATGLSRTAWHRVDVVAKFYNGSANDTFEITLDGVALINSRTGLTTFGTFEGFFDFTLQSPVTSNRLFWRSGAAPSAFDASFVDTTAAGFYFDDLDYRVSSQAAPNISLASYAATFEPAVPGAQTVLGTGGDDLLEVFATDINSGSYQLNGGPLTAFSGINTFTFSALGGNDTFRIYNPVGGGLFAPAGGVSYEGGDGTDRLVATGTNVNDTFSVAQTTGAVTINNSVTLSQSAVEILQMEGLDGDDTFNLAGGHPFASVTVNGGDPSGSDVLFLTGAAATVETVTIAPDSVNPTEQDITGLGAPINVSGVELIRYTGAGADDTLIVAPGNGDEAARVEAQNNLGIDRVLADTLPEIQFAGLNTFRLNQLLGIDTATFALGQLNGATIYQVQSSAGDTVVVEGFDGGFADEFTVTKPAVGAFAVRSTFDFNKTLTETSSTGARLELRTFGGNDRVIVDNSTGLVTNPITLQAGSGSDVLRLIGSTAITTAAYTPGPTNDSGVVEHTLGSATQRIEFTGLEPVQDNVVAASLIIDGTNADNSINYTAGAAGGIFGGNLTGLISVDSFETYEFSQKSNLTINGLAGSDTINLNNTNTPTGLIGTITVNGGDPTASDTLIVNGISGQLDNLRYLPTSVGAGTVVNDSATQPNVLFTGVEHLTLVIQQADGDGIRVDGTAGNDAVEYFHGPTSGSGSFAGTMDQNNGTGAGPFTMTPMSYSGASPLANDSDVNFFNPGGTDSFVFNGTASDDTISVAGGEAGGTEFRNTLNGIVVSRIEVFNVATARVRGSDGDDTFNHSGSIAIPVAYEGGDPSASDVLNFTGTGGLVTVETDLQTVTVAPFGAVSYSGIEQLNVNAAGGPVDINGSLDDDAFTVRPNDATGAEVTLAGVNTVFQISNTLDLEIDGDNGVGFENSVTVIATEGDDVIGVTGTAVSIAGRLPVNLSDIQRVSVLGEAGSDTFNVTPSATTSIFIDGGNPIGVLPGDTLSIVAGGGAVAFSAGPESDEGAFTVTGGANPGVVSFDHIETFSPIIGAGGATITGTNGADAITIIARDASYNAAADGVQDFTVSVNGGPEILYVNTPTLTVNALGGSDEIAVFTPAPNLAVWDVDLTIDGGQPSAGGDTVIFGTLGTDIVTFTPSGADSGTLAITNLSSTTTLTQVEHVVYNGVSAAGLDELTINGSFNDTTNYDASTFLGSYRSILSPALDFSLVGRLTVNAGVGDFDVVNITGSAGDDIVTSTADAITVNTPGSFAIVTIGAGIDLVTLSTLDGNDNIDLDLNVTGLRKTVDAGAGNDIVNLAGTIDATIFGGTGNDTITGSPADDLIFGGSGNDILIGGGGSDTQYGEDGNDIFGNLTLTPDGVADDAGVDFNFGGEGFDNFVWEPGDGADVNNGGNDGADIFRFFGNAAANVFTLQSGGTPTHFNALIGAVNIDNHGIEDVIVDGQGGADTFTINDLFATEVVSINLNLGAADAGAIDPVIVNGRNEADNLVLSNPAAGTLSIQGLRYNVNLTNAEATDTLLVNGNDGDDSITAAAGTSTVITLTLSGGAGNDVLNASATVGTGVTLEGDAGDDTLIGGSGNDTMRGEAVAPFGNDTFVGNGGTDAVGAGGGLIGDRILIPGTPGNDVMNLALNAAGHLQVTINGVTTTYTNFVGGAIDSSGVDLIAVNGDAGNDSVTIDSSLGALPIPVEFDGGSGSDSLTFTGGVATSDVYSVGPNPGQGTSTIVIGGITQLVTFSNLEPVIDLVGGPLTVNANNADNAINYTQGTVAANGLVSIDIHETIEFSNKTTLTINALAGSDTINLNNPSTPTGLTGITVNGGDPTASDTVIVNGTAALNAITVDLLTEDGGRVTGAQPVPVVVAGTELLVINGQNGSDSLTYVTPAGDHFVEYSSGGVSAPDSGSIRTLDNNNRTLLAVDHQDLGDLGSVTFADAGGGRADVLFLNGTANDDRFNVQTSGNIQLQDRPVGFFVSVQLSTPGIGQVELRGLAGDDEFNIPGNHPFAGLFGAAIVVQGGDPSASDTLNFTGAGAAVTVDLAASTVGETGFGAVTFSGIEILNASAGAGAITINGTTGPDNISVTPTSATTATITATGVATTFNTTNAATLTIDPLTGSDNVSVIGTQNGETITVTAGLVTVGALKPVTYSSTNTENLRIIAQAGNDTIDVTPSATTTIFVDGGDPIGSTPGDLIVLHPPGAFTVEPGPENDEGGLNASGVQRVSWDHIERVTVVGGPGGPGVILGTNGDDDITIIARDSSTHLGTDGVQDFTVSVNDGPDILYINVPVLLVDALAGDDDIVIREPAPNNAVWNVQLFIAGGTPASPTGDQGDVVELETPGTQTVIYTPNPAVIPVPALPAGVTITPTVGGIDTAIINDTTNTSAITIAPFTLNVAGLFNYISSPGGAEQIIYQGLAGGDNLTINGTASNDTTTVNPTGQGSGSFRSGLSPTFDFTGATVLTVNPGTGGFDVLNIDGSAGVDTVTSTATTVSFAGAGSVTIGAGIDRMKLSTYDSNDSVILSLGVAGLDKIVDAGNGNDIVNMTAVTTDATIYGGDGDDTITGSPTADLIFGGSGNDILIGAGGNDVIYGEDGNDIFGNSSSTPNGVADDGGNDTFFGGDGSDLFVWEPGDGSDLIEGGAGSGDELRFIGNAGNNRVEIFGGGGSFLNPAFNMPGDAERAVVALNSTAFLTATVFVDTADVEAIHVDLLGGTDELIINNQVPNVSTAGSFLQTGTNLASTHLRSITGDLGSLDAVVDRVEVHGNLTADDLLIRSLGTNFTLGPVDVAGFNYSVDINQSVGGVGGDLLVVRGQTGDDTIKANDGTEVRINLQLDGDEGDDFLSADAVINGGAGDDFLEGGSGDDTLNGGAGEDTMIGRGGADTYDGGADFDTILIEGTSGNDAIDVAQTAATTLVYTVNGNTQTDTLVTIAGVRTVESARIEAGAGDDTIRVTHADALGVDGLVNSLRIDVHGGAASTRDRLGVVDDTIGDLVLYRKGESDSEGSITVGPGNPEPLEVTFDGIETVQPVSALGQIRVFKHDPLEWNDNLVNATYLGANDAINVDPNIDPGLDPIFGLPADQDFFRIVAEFTGILDIQVYFTQLAAVGGRPGLPNAGNLDVELYDVDGTLIVDGVLGGLDFGINDATDNERIRIPAVAGQTYYLRVLPNGTAINTYSITTINTAAPVPFDIELLDTPINTANNSTTGAPGATAVGLSSDTGRSRFDDITFDNDPTILIRVPNVIQVGGLSFIDDIPANGNGATPGSPPDETILIPFVTSTALNAPSAGFRVAVFVTENNTTDAVLAGYAQPIAGRPGVFTFTFANDALAPDGSYFISSSVEMIDPTSPEQNQGFGDLAESLETIIDTILPPASFGSPGVGNDGLILSDDCPTPLINLTNVARPTFWGRAEADTVINLYLDSNANGTFDPATDVFLGQTVATPFDGGDQYPNGYWEIESRLSLNDPSLIVPIGVLPLDGPRTLFITAEDVAGNITGTPAVVATTLQIVIDTQGPQVTDVDINNAGNPYDLFDPKPSTDGPTPLVNSIVISFQDLPARVAGTLYVALEAGTIVPGNFLLVGDYNGIIPIQDIILVNNPPVAGFPATATVELVFRTPGPDGIFNTTDDIGKPLPDDRFTLTVRDSVTDPLCNALNGESNASEPQENPTFPSGDAHNGGDFIARFTVDSRAEVGTWGAGAAWIDTNGNTTFDQDNADFTNRDITYYLGYTSDNLFAGNFVKAAGGTADGFDKLAAYGRVGTQWRVLIDVNNDGVITPGVDIAQVQPGASGINGVPVAGNFDGNAANGDEFGVFTGTTWYFDTNHDWILDPGSAVAWTQNGYPVVGNFDGVAGDDLATYRDNTFFIDFGRNGSIDRTFRFGFPTPNNRPVSADVDRDGHDDLGLFVPNRAGVSPDEDAEWYILVSGGARLVDRIHADPIDGVPVIDYKPVPFGNDIYIQYGDEFGLPILGNFDPPVAPGGGTSTSFPSSNPNNPLDVNNDGFVSPIDALLVVNEINTNGSHPLDTSGFHTAPFIDVDRDNVVSPHDVLLVINKLNEPVSSPSGEGEGEADAHDALFSELGAASTTSVPSAADDAGGLLSLLADDQLRAKRSRAAE